MEAFKCNLFATWLNEKLARSSFLACDLAEKSGLSRKTISDLKNGRHLPRFETVVALCDVFHDNPGKVWNLVVANH